MKIVNELEKLIPNMIPSTRALELLNYTNLEVKRERAGSIYEKTGLFPSEQLLENMAVCHSLTYVKGSMIGTIFIDCLINFFLGDPLDLKMFESTKWTFEENDQQKYDSLVLAVVKSPFIQARSFIPGGNEPSAPIKTEIGIIRRFEFSSKLQRMSVVVKNLDETGFKVHIKGSPEKIRELCRPETVPENYHHILEKYTEVIFYIKAVF